MAKEKYLECGKAVSTHGVRGTLRLECYCDTPEKLAKMRRMYIRTASGEMKLMKVRAASVQKSMVLVTFEDITDLNQAILYKGTTFYADRADMKLEKNQVFIADWTSSTRIPVRNTGLWQMSSPPADGKCM